MRKFLPFLLLLSACSGQTESDSASLKSLSSSEAKPSETKNHFTWTGFINHKIPVFLHYTLQDKIIVGEIYYLNTKTRKPIQVLGSIEEDKSYRLLEFGVDGNISGIITGIPKEKIFEGSWFSPKTRKEFSLNLKSKDTSVRAVDLKPADNDISGDYHYQYSEEGHQGDLEVKKVGSDKIAFSIFSVTSDPARNLAEVPTDTVNMTGNSFIYTIPGSDSCEFSVTFYKGIAIVSYTRGYCDGQFGMNATVDGIFLKTKN